MSVVFVVHGLDIIGKVQFEKVYYFYVKPHGQFSYDSMISLTMLNEMSKVLNMVILILFHFQPCLPIKNIQEANYKLQTIGSHDVILFPISRKNKCNHIFVDMLQRMKWIKTKSYTFRLFVNFCLCIYFAQVYLHLSQGNSASISTPSNSLSPSSVAMASNSASVNGAFEIVAGFFWKIIWFQISKDYL